MPDYCEAAKYYIQSATERGIAPCPVAVIIIEQQNKEIERLKTLLTIYEPESIEP